MPPLACWTSRTSRFPACTPRATWSAACSMATIPVAQDWPAPPSSGASRDRRPRPRPDLTVRTGCSRVRRARVRGMATIVGAKVHVGAVDEVRNRGCVQVSGGGHGIAVFAHEGRFYAVDNRCPHMGFPLSRGTVHDGLLTCHWHHARFDLQGGGTLDPFADNVRTYPILVEDGSVYVLTEDRPDQPSRSTYWLGRLEEGL